jgi:hypothetical protein
VYQRRVQQGTASMFFFFFFFFKKFAVMTIIY